MTLLRTVPEKKSPYSNTKIGSVGFTVGAEGSNIITVAVQLKDRAGGDLAVRGRVKAYLSGDANGDTLVAYGPNTSILAGTDGVLIPGPPKQTCTLIKGTLAIDATAEKFKTTTTATFRVNNVTYTKTAATAILFTAAHTITASTFGVVLVQVTPAGVVSTKVPSATQAYASAALALAALPQPDAGNAALGYIAIANNAGDWVANTDDLTNGSDLTTASFVDIEEPCPASFDLISESDGDIDVAISETLVKNTMYLVVILPDGTLSVSGAIIFA